MYFYMIFEETIESTRRGILWVLVGIFGKEEMKVCLLIKTVSFTDKTSSYINRKILKTLNNFLALISNKKDFD